MRALTATELLSVWENGGAKSAPHRALLLLGAAAPEATPEELGRLPVGQRDDLLFRLRASAFGPGLEATAVCPSCGEKLEMAFGTDDLRAPVASASGAPLTLEFAGHALTFRLPDGSDLVEMTAVSDLAEAEAALLRRCVLSARSGERVVSPEELPEPVVTALAAQLAEADPQADVQLSLTCPVCDHRWEEPFDIVTFFWREIEAWAARILSEVHTLATAYGWSEAEIVSLSPARRRRYLELVAAA
jgi:hypothetical protein